MNVLLSRVGKSIPLNEITRELARYCGFTAAELGFIVNFIKYRLGRDTGGE